MQEMQFLAGSASSQTNPIDPKKNPTLLLSNKETIAPKRNPTHLIIKKEHPCNFHEGVPVPCDPLKGFRFPSPWRPIISPTN